MNGIKQIYKVIQRILILMLVFVEIGNQVQTIQSVMVQEEQEQQILIMRHILD